MRAELRPPHLPPSPIVGRDSSLSSWLEGNKKHVVPVTAGSRLTIMRKVSLRRKPSQVEGRVERILDDGVISLRTLCTSIQSMPIAHPYFRTSHLQSQ